MSHEWSLDVATRRGERRQVTTPAPDGPHDDDLRALVDRVPLGWSRQTIGGRAWGITRVDHAGGRSSTLEGEELGGTRRMSANVWRTSAGMHLKPCEMPAEQVLEVLRALPKVSDGDRGATAS